MKLTPKHTGSHGMTLVELLVAMAIFSLIMTLVAQAMSQVGSVVRVADEASTQLSGRWSRGGAVSAAFNNLVASREAGNRPFVGRPESIEGLTTQPLELADLGVGPIALELQPGSGTPSHTLLNARFAIRQESDSSVWKAVGQFEGRAEFAFRNRRGDWVQQWPQLTAQPTAMPELLPSAIMVRDADTGRLLMAYVVSASEKVQTPPNLTPFQSSAP